MTRLLRLVLLCVLATCAVGLLSSTASAQDAKKERQYRRARFEWDAEKKRLRATLRFYDVVNAAIRKKLSRGLPTTIVFTGTVFQKGKKKATSTTVQACKVTWHVWEEAYRVEIRRPGSSRTRWVATVGGVLRRCAQARRLLISDASQTRPGSAVYMLAKIQVNPISKDLLERLKRWVSRPSGTSTAAPGDALFSTFTGLFLQRVGSAERELEFRTVTRVPRVRRKKKKKKKKERR